MKNCENCAAFGCSSIRNERCDKCDENNVNWTEQLTEEEKYDIECNNVDKGMHEPIRYDNHCS